MKVYKDQGFRNAKGMEILSLSHGGIRRSKSKEGQLGEQVDRTSVIAYVATTSYNIPLHQNVEFSVVRDTAKTTREGVSRAHGLRNARARGRVNGSMRVMLYTLGQLRSIRPKWGHEEFLFLWITGYQRGCISHLCELFASSISHIKFPTTAAASR